MSHVKIWEEKDTILIDENEFEALDAEGHLLVSRNLDGSGDQLIFNVTEVAVLSQHQDLISDYVASHFSIIHQNITVVVLLRGSFYGRGMLFRGEDGSMEFYLNDQLLQPQIEYFNPRTLQQPQPINIDSVEYRMRAKWFPIGRKRRERKQQEQARIANNFITTNIASVNQSLSDLQNVKEKIDSDILQLSEKANRLFNSIALQDQQDIEKAILTFEQLAVQKKDDFKRYYYGSHTVITNNTKEQVEEIGKLLQSDFNPKVEGEALSQQENIGIAYKDFDADMFSIEKEYSSKTQLEGRKRSLSYNAQSGIDPNLRKLKSDASISGANYIVGEIHQERLDIESSANEYLDHATTGQKKDFALSIGKIETKGVQKSITSEKDVFINQARNLRTQFENAIDTLLVQTKEKAEILLKTRLVEIDTEKKLFEKALENYYHLTFDEMDNNAMNINLQIESLLQQFSSEQTGLKTPKTKHLQEAILQYSELLIPILNQLDLLPSEYIQLHNNKVTELQQILQQQQAESSTQHTKSISDFITQETRNFNELGDKGIQAQLDLRDDHIQGVFKRKRSLTSRYADIISNLQVQYTLQLSDIKDKHAKLTAEYEQSAKEIYGKVWREMDSQEAYAVDLWNIAGKIYNSYKGPGTYVNDAKKQLKLLAPYGGDKYNKTNEIYLTRFGDNRNIIDDTIHEMLDNIEDLKEVFETLQYNASDKVVEWLNRSDWDTDSLAYAMRDEDFYNFSVDERIKLLQWISKGNVQDDETTLIRLVKFVKLEQLPLFFEKLSNNPDLLQQLEDKIDFSDYTEYHKTLYATYLSDFYSNQTMEEAVAELENPTHPVFQYRNPSKITNAFKRRHYLEDVRIESGKIKFTYWVILVAFGDDREYSFDPFDPIIIEFLDDEPLFDAKPGQRILMPAISLLALEDEQNMREGKLVVDVALTVSGAGGIFNAATKAGKIWAGVELLMAVADITINELRYQISQTEKGKEFLKYWDITSTVITIYGIGRVAIELPGIFKKLKDSYKAYKNTKQAAELGKENFNKVEELIEEIDEVKKVDLDDPKKIITPPKNPTKPSYNIGDIDGKELDDFENSIDDFDDALKDVEKSDLKNLDETAELGNDVKKSEVDSGKNKETRNTKSGFYNKLEEVENKLKTITKEEHVYRIDTEGKIYGPKKGDLEKVNFEELGPFKNGDIITHNHPSGAPFSVEDIFNLAELPITELRAVTKNKVYIIKKIGNFNYFTWRIKYDDLVKQFRINYADKIKSGISFEEKIIIQEELLMESFKNFDVKFIIE